MILRFLGHFPFSTSLNYTVTKYSFLKDLFKDSVHINNSIWRGI
jgi:hypothetical protein